jgi:hypothetical protein
MVAAMPYRLTDDHDDDPWREGSPGREVLAAWAVAMLLLAGALVSFTLDQVVTVSPDPIATYGSALKAEEEDEAPSLIEDRELRDRQD